MYAHQTTASNEVGSPEDRRPPGDVDAPDPLRLHPADLLCIAEHLVHVVRRTSAACSCAASDKDVLPPGATYATAGQIARRFQISEDEVYATPTFFGAVQRPGKHKRYCVATADANWAAHRVEATQPGRRRARSNRSERLQVGPPLVDFT